MHDEINYQEDAKDRLAKCGGELIVKLSNTKTSPWADKDPRYQPHYRCTLKGPGGSYVFDFWGSIADGETGKMATTYDVLACLEWNCSEDFADFCATFGYDEDSRKAHKTWKACLAQCRALHRVLPSETARECLSEIR